MSQSATTQARPARVPLIVKLGFTLCMLVLVPFYWQAYGPTNFLYLLLMMAALPALLWAPAHLALARFMKGSHA